MLTPTLLKCLSEFVPDLLPALLSEEVLRLQRVNTQVVQLPPVHGVVPVRLLGLQTLVQQVDVLGISVQGGSNCVPCNNNEVIYSYFIIS